MRLNIKTKLDTFSIRRSLYNDIYVYYTRPNFTHTTAASDILPNGSNFWRELYRESAAKNKDIDIINWGDHKEVLKLLIPFFGYE